MKIHAYLIDLLKKTHTYNQKRHFKLLPARENKKRKRFELANEIPHGVKKGFLSLTWAREIIQKILANIGKRCFRISFQLARVQPARFCCVLTQYPCSPFI